MFSHLNEDHLQRVLIERGGKFGQVRMTQDYEELSSFIGHDIQDKKTGERYLITRFVKHWMIDGWCIIAKLQRYEGHFNFTSINVIWENISSTVIADNDQMYKNFRIYNLQ